MPTTEDCAERVGPKTTYFLADIERYTLMIAHTVQGIETDITIRNQDMHGQLVGSDGRLLRDFPMDQRYFGDILSVGEALQAAGDINLDGNKYQNLNIFP